MDTKPMLLRFSFFLLAASAVWAGFSQHLTAIEAASAIGPNQLSPSGMETEGSAIATSQSQIIAQQGQVKQGEVYKLMNGGATRTRQSSAVRAKTNPRTDLIPRDILTTDTTAKAEILFKQQDTIVRLGESTSFVFPEGLREYQLNNGTIVSMIRPGKGGGTVKTPQASVIARGTGMYIQQCSDRKVALFAILTNNNAEVEPTRVVNGRGDRVSLRAGQLVRVVDGTIQSVQTFNLRSFYQNNPMGAGLGPNQENVVNESPTDVQPVFREVRQETIAAVNSQSEGSFDFPNGIPNVCGNGQAPVRGLW
ncbi:MULTISPECIES: FecR domain-containing protein [Kamptonema]|uniref:FecR domain-containing protein n=1 Tax=Kamptonema TaxID=1501433 RepID=UPI0001DAD1CE|nr:MULTISPECIES: FecR domain-containing protein [Kamptonema]CBN55836.1 exported hypothetical protein [Kamptonema sp. PCC 6506]